MPYYLYCILLENCKYSNNANKILKQYNIPCKLRYISHDMKDIYKTEFIQSFPQIYLRKTYHLGSLLLGGYDNLNHIITNCINNKYNKNIEILKMNNWSNRAIYHLLNLIKKNI